MSKKRKKKLKDASKLMDDSFGLDPHLKPKASDLGDEDLGEGMFQKKVRVHRDAAGNVTQLIDADKPLTKEELKKLQEKQSPSSPYLPGNSPFKKAKGQILGPKDIYS